MKDNLSKTSFSFLFTHEEYFLKAEVEPGIFQFSFIFSLNSSAPNPMIHPHVTPLGSTGLGLSELHFSKKKIVSWL